MNIDLLNRKIDLEICELLDDWTSGIDRCLGDNRVGLYLTGSLTYGDFVERRSDIDLSVVVRHALSRAELDAVKDVHLSVEKKFPKFKERIECSYIPIDLLPEVLPPATPRPWYGFGVLYETAPYGNEWIINKYFLWKYGIALVGPGFDELVEQVDMRHVQEACARDLFREWAPKRSDPEWLADSHFQSYLVLNICRILYTVLRSEAGSKRAASSWVADEFPQWADVIEAAQEWSYGVEMNRAQEAVALVEFAIEKVSESGIACE